MPVKFVQVGSHWVNLELVASIEMVEDQQQPGQYQAARIHYSNGKTQDFLVLADFQHLASWLKSHKAK